MRAFLIFNLPEDEHQYKLVNKALPHYMALKQVDRACRDWIKHGHPFVSIVHALEKIREIIREELEGEIT